MDIHWDRAVYKELNVGDGLFFPVNSSANREGKHYISSTGSSKRFSVDYASFSMAYKDEEGKVILEYVLPIATSDTERFTGYLLVSDWQGDAKRKVYYDNGEIIDVVAIYKQTTENSDVNNLRMQGCTITDHWWCVTASSPTGNSYTTCTYEGSTIYCEPPQGLAPSDPCGCDGSGGGSSDPSGPGGLCEHPFIEGMYVDCDEVICSEGFVADESGNCVPEPDPCQTDNAIFNNQSVQSDLLTIWSGSGATDENVPMNDRVEQGGWIVETNGGYDVVFFPPTFARDACGITPPSNWTSLIPANTVGYVHSHPFYVGENTLGPCGEGGEESYAGGPSDADYEFLTLTMNHLNDFTLKGFVIDGNKIYGYDFTHSGGVVEYVRCGY